MINKNIVYKIKYTALLEGAAKVYGQESWVHGYSVCVKVGGSGKTFTDKKIVNRMFSAIQENPQYNVSFKCEIVTFKLEQISSSAELV